MKLKNQNATEIGNIFISKAYHDRILEFHKGSSGTGPMADGTEHTGVGGCTRIFYARNLTIKIII